MSDADDAVERLLDRVVPAKRQRDARTMLAVMTRVTGQPPVVDRNAVGFGSYHYRYASGREGDAPLASFSPRKSALTLYVSAEEDTRAGLLARLGPHTTGKSCVYVKRLSDVDEQALVELIRAGAAFARAQDVAS